MSKLQAIDLILLFTGDYLSEPAPRVSLAAEICRKLNPESFEHLLVSVYNHNDPKRLDEETLDRLERGFQRYKRERERK